MPEAFQGSERRRARLRRPRRVPPSSALALLLVTAVSQGCGRDIPRAASASDDRTPAIRYSLLENFDDVRVESAPVGPVDARLVSVGGRERPAIFSHAPARFRFDRVPADAGSLLRFGIGLADGIPAGRGDGALLTVSVAAAGSEPVEVWRHELLPPADEASHTWQDFEVDLGQPPAGPRTILFDVKPHGSPNYDWVAWSNPTLSDPQGRPPGPRGPISVETADFDLLAAHPTPVVAGQPPPAIRATAPEISTSFTIPADAYLELEGELDANGGGDARGVGPVHFEARVGETLVFERDLQTILTSASFRARVPLADSGGRKERVTLGISNREPARQVAGWQLARVVVTKKVDRASDADGLNLLLVVVDTLRADHLHFMGYERPTSPNLDALARRSVVFKNAFSQASWTLPSVATIMTGVYPAVHQANDGIPLPRGFETLAEVLEREGLSTFAVSSSPIIGHDENMAQGFETFLQFPWAIARTVDRLFLQWLGRQGSRRWFAYLHYIDPHDPYNPPSAFRSGYTRGIGTPYADRDEWDRLKAAVNFGAEFVQVDRRNLTGVVAAYDNEIRYWDAAFSKVIAALREKGLLEKTVIVITSDHGEEFLEHGGLSHGTHLYEESIHVPLVIWTPTERSGRLVTDPVELRGIMGTALDLLGVKDQGTRPEGALLRGAGGGNETEFAETTHAWIRARGAHARLVSVRRDGWKLIRRMEDGEEELFDLTDDPAELLDRIHWSDPHEKELEEVLTQWLEKCERSRKAVTEADPRMIGKLRALGYVQ